MADESEPLPNLGCATTRDILEELEARMDFYHSNDTVWLRYCVRYALRTLGRVILEYRTIDH